MTDASSVGDEVVNQFAEQFGGDYLSAEDNPMPAVDADAVLDGAATGEQEEETEEAAGDNEAEATTEAEAKAAPAGEAAKEEPAEEQAEDEKAKEEETKAEAAARTKEEANTRRRLAIVERAEQKMRAEEARIKADISSQISSLEAKAAAFDTKIKDYSTQHAARMETYQSDPMKMLEDFKIPFEQIAVANMERHGYTIPPELAAAAAKHRPPARPIPTKEDIAALVQENVRNALAEFMTASQQQAQQEEQLTHKQRVEQVENNNRNIAVGFVREHAEEFPLTTALFRDPAALAEQMLLARAEIYEQTGSIGSPGDAARYIESALVDRVGGSGYRRSGQPPRTDSGKQTPPGARNESSASTLSNSSADRVSRGSPEDMEERYEREWGSLL